MEDYSNSSMYRNFELKSMKDNLIIENSLTVHNTDPTFFHKNIISCIDHIMSNCPLNISNVRTHTSNNHSNYINIAANIINNSNPIMSDHAILSCTYNNKNINLPQQFKIIRNHNLLTKHNLHQYFKDNDNLNHIQ